MGIRSIGGLRQVSVYALQVGAKLIDEQDACKKVLVIGVRRDELDHRLHGPGLRA